MPFPEDFDERLVRAVAFRNVIAHGYEGLALDLVWRAGLADLRAFMGTIAEDR